MKQLKKKALFVASALFLSVGANATVITFSEVALNTADPVIGTVSFWAGDGTVFYDTFIAEYMSAGDPYLMSGVADGTGFSPATGYNTFIGVSKSGTAFGSVSFDILSEFNLPALPPSTTLWVEAYLAGLPVGSSSVAVSDNAYHTLALASAGGFDKLYIFDTVNNGYGQAFHIDNFNYTEYQDDGGGDDGGNTVPEPASLLLLGLGLAGMAFSRRYKAV